ncbi:Differentially expressed in FDCP 8 [Mactra antiquata]
MSSLELSDEICSSEDEDVIIAKMERKSGLPDKKSSEFRNVVQSESSIATVKMSGMIQHRDNLYDSSDSEDEVMYDDDYKFTSDSLEASNTFSVNSRKVSNDSRSSSVLTVKSSMTSSSDVTINGNVSMETSDSNIIRHDSMISESSELSEPPSSYTETRFNPFDRDLHVDEDHFETKNHLIRNNVENRQSKTESKSSGSSWTEASVGASDTSPTSDDITFADLGLAEDHFSQPEGFFGMTSTEEIEMAIETCKEMIIMANPHSDRQKNLVKKLVQLRMKLQELKEGPMPVEEGVKMVVGHKFMLHSGSTSKHYCEKCNAVIWGVLQEWYKCSDCGYCAHLKCLNQITRTCASVKVQEDPVYSMEICYEKGLSSQNYRCAECRGQISFKSGYSEPRLCDYSGNYFCELCHWNDSMLIPARVLHNWDFDEWKVCRASKQYLKLMEKKAVIRIQDINPMLFSFVDELNEVKKMREELLIMKRYILLCAVAMNEKLLLQLKGRQHFVESSDIYSMRDLIDVHRDSLLPELVQVHSSWAQHIKTDCELCRAKGFICELCDMDEILFPFDNIAVVCSKCSYVLHRHCFAKRSGVCPRCERRNKRHREIPES